MNSGEVDLAQGEVLIYAEVQDERPQPTTLELLGVGRSLAQALGAPLSAALLGHQVQDAAQELGAYGADRVYLADHPDLEGYRSDPHLRLLEKLCREEAPSILLFSHDSAGRDLAPRLAARLETGLAPDCVELALAPQSHRLVAIRPIYGGNLRAVLAMDTDPQIATLRPKTVEPATRQQGRPVEVIRVDVTPDPSILRVKVLQRLKEEVTGVRLEDAEVIVTGGRGIEDQEGVKIVEGLARLLGAAVGATRGSVDANLLPGELQVGLTGKMVAPRLYFAVGLSGSMQHMAGCSGAKTIVAINTDPQAAIFQRAHYGVVGDFREVVPRLTEKLRELLGG